MVTDAARQPPAGDWRQGAAAVALHGHSHRVLPGMTPKEQRRDLELGLESLTRLGVQPRGYRAPYWRMTRATLDLLGRHGIRYDSSLMDDDRPYRLADIVWGDPN